MKRIIPLLALLGGTALSALAVVSGPDNVYYGSISLGGTQITAGNTNYFVAARLSQSGSPIATYYMGSLPSAGNSYSLRVAAESVAPASAPNAVVAGQLLYIDVDQGSTVLAQTSLRAGAPGKFTLLNFGGSTTVASSTGSLLVTIVPSAAAAAGAQWQLDGGAPQNSGVLVTNISTGTNHLVHFLPATNWTAPPDQTFTVANGVTAPISGIYYQPVAGLTLLTNGYGSIQHAFVPANLVLGRSYHVTASAKPKNVFVNWVGGTNQPYTVLSTLPSYTFTMTSNLVLEANFQTNVFLDAKGIYRGLFVGADTNSARGQSTSGAFMFNVSQTGAASGMLYMGAQNLPFSGKISADGSANILTRATAAIPATHIALQMDFNGQVVSGVISNSSMMAYLDGARDGFSASAPATAFEGQYTFIIPGTTNAAMGPLGNGYGTVKIGSTGRLTMTGSLADGTPISEASGLSQDGAWPLYVRLYNGKGSIWGWVSMINHSMTAPSTLSWINATNSAKTAVMRSGFTNQAVALSGGIYTGFKLPAGLPTTLWESAPAFYLSVTNVGDSSVRLTTHTNTASGLITGKFINPIDPAQSIKFNGVVLQSQTNAQGYFIANGTSGSYETGN